MESAAGRAEVTCTHLRSDSVLGVGEEDIKHVKGVFVKGGAALQADPAGEPEKASLCQDGMASLQRNLNHTHSL